MILKLNSFISNSGSIANKNVFQTFNQEANNWTAWKTNLEASRNKEKNNELKLYDDLNLYLRFINNKFFNEFKDVLSEEFSLYIKSPICMKDIKWVSFIYTIVPILETIEKNIDTSLDIKGKTSGGGQDKHTSLMHNGYWSIVFRNYLSNVLKRLESFEHNPYKKHIKYFPDADHKTTRIYVASNLETISNALVAFLPKEKTSDVFQLRKSKVSLFIKGGLNLAKVHFSEAKKKFQKSGSEPISSFLFEESKDDGLHRLHLARFINKYITDASDFISRINPHPPLTPWMNQPPFKSILDISEQLLEMQAPNSFGSFENINGILTRINEESLMGVFSEFDDNSKVKYGTFISTLVLRSIDLEKNDVVKSVAADFRDDVEVLNQIMYMIMNPVEKEMKEVCLMNPRVCRIEPDGASDAGSVQTNPSSTLNSSSVGSVQTNLESQPNSLYDRPLKGGYAKKTAYIKLDKRKRYIYKQGTDFYIKLDGVFKQIIVDKARQYVQIL